jgi:hypothetical protein
MNILSEEYVFIMKLFERIKTLEEKVFPQKKKSTRAQQILMLKHSGMLEALNSFKLSKKGKAEFLSNLLNLSSENIEDDLTYIDSPESPIVTQGNYEFLEKVFSEKEFESQKKKIQNILDNLHKKGNPSRLPL